ncbi:hemin ABC transporter ATP-binding protein [bacterium]|nr:MAG: hemin ABC transporter ATP-binding protein [bacterium]RKZ18102.1 MAG: hemin ABC transporter ATP-binding protein [bacterium]
MMLEATALRFAWPGQPQLLDGVELHLGDGELVALVGANGSGKSTLLRILAGLLRADSGAVQLGGSDLEGLDEGARARLRSYLPQHVRPLYSMSARRMVELARHPWPDRGTDPAIIDDALRQCDVFDLADRPFGELSGGEGQRVLLAGALAQGGKLLLLDEPTAALDLPHCVAVFSSLRAQLNEGRSALVATHDLNLAAAWADRVLLLHDGKVLANGAPVDVLRQDILDRALGPGIEVIVHPHHGGPRVLPRGWSELR